MPTKTKRSKKPIHKKLLRKKNVRRLYQLFFALIFTTSVSSIVFALALSKAPVKLNVGTQIRPVSVTIPVNPAANLSPDQAGSASWYALGLPHPLLHTCASTRFPRGTYLLVKNVRNNKTVVCLVNDYGPAPFTGRVIDLSLGSFQEIESTSRGTTPVTIHVVPAPPSGLNLPFPTTFAQVLGYNLCRSHFSANFCETNRSSGKLHL